MYTNLVTSALGLSRRRAEELRAAGLDHVQISVQADEPAMSDRIAGTPSFERKVEACRLVKELGWPLTLNVVLHRQNIDRVGAVLRLAEELDADRIELANTQYYGWAWRNRAGLLPSRAQLEQAERVVSAARKRLAGRMDVDLRAARLLQPVSQALHGRLGATPAHRGAERRRPALPDRADAPVPARERPGGLAGLDLERVAALPELPRHGLDAGSVPELRSPRDRLRRMPMPGVPAHRRRRRAPIRSATCRPTTTSWRTRCAPRTRSALRSSCPSSPVPTGWGVLDVQK